MIIKNIDKLLVFVMVLTTCVLTIATSHAQSVIANTCPSATGDLTAVITSSAPAGTVITFHTSDPASDGNKYNGDPTEAPTGTYYAAYWDETNSCYSPVSFPIHVAKCIVNECPDSDADISSTVSSPAPAGTVVSYHTGTPASDANKYSGDVTKVPAGTYYAAYWDETNSCYSPTSLPVVVDIKDCGKISGSVLADENANGTADQPLSGVTIKLYDEDDNLISTTVTDDEGKYSFDAPLGMYKVVQEQPGDYTTINSNSADVNLGVANTNLTVPAFLETNTQALPITLNYFDAIKSGSSVKLSWSTLSEINNEIFVLEYSFDSKEFNKLTEVKAVGNSQIEQKYDYIHKNIESYSKSIYYRLRQIDFDGKSTYVGGVKHISFGENKTIKISPVPAGKNQEITITMSHDPGAFILYNSVGKVIMTGDPAGEEILVINTTGLNSGIYFIRFRDGNTEKIIVR